MQSLHHRSGLFPISRSDYRQTGFGVPSPKALRVRCVSAGRVVREVGGGLRHVRCRSFQRQHLPFTVALRALSLAQRATNKDRAVQLGEAGVEPARVLPQRILSPQRLPFRHSPAASCASTATRPGPHPSTHVRGLNRSGQTPATPRTPPFEPIRWDSNPRRASGSVSLVADHPLW